MFAFFSRSIFFLIFPCAAYVFTEQILTFQENYCVCRTEAIFRKVPPLLNRYFSNRFLGCFLALTSDDDKSKNINNHDTVEGSSDKNSGHKSFIGKLLSIVTCIVFYFSRFLSLLLSMTI